MNYTKELIFELRLQGVVEKEISDIVKEVQERIDGGADPVDEFGQPAEYASAFAGDGRRKGSRVWMYLGVAIGLLWIAGVLILSVAGVIDPNQPGLLALLPAVGIMAIGLLASFFTDRHAPVRS